jgi:leucyl/phenylalanyl-tRNA--protein transferase
MPVYRLGREPRFPPPESADEDGLLAIGGRLTVPWLLAAYREGIFPWYDRPPILWWSPDPRLVLVPSELRVSRSLRGTIRKGRFQTRFDTDFRAVMQACGSIERRHERGTWINPDLIDGYTSLFEQGLAHSSECWCEGELVGGLYGVCLGRMFFGESMFSRVSDASKVALVALVEALQARSIALIDCQIRTEHLVRLGAREIRRTEFLRQVRSLVREPNPSGPWTATATDPED